MLWTKEDFEDIANAIKDDGVLTTYSTALKTRLALYENNFNVYQVPFTEIAHKDVGLKILANIVMLGALTKITNIISKEAIEKAILDSVPKGTEKKNILAFGKGYNYI